MIILKGRTDDQFHPSYTRMAPAHYITKIELLGCPDPNPVISRFFQTGADKFFLQTSQNNWVNCISGFYITK